MSGIPDPAGLSLTNDQVARGIAAAIAAEGASLIEAERYAHAALSWLLRAGLTIVGTPDAQSVSEADDRAATAQRRYLRPRG